MIQRLVVPLEREIPTIYRSQLERSMLGGWTIVVGCGGAVLAIVPTGTVLCAARLFLPPAFGVCVSHSLRALETREKDR